MKDIQNDVENKEAASRKEYLEKRKDDCVSCRGTGVHYDDGYCYKCDGTGKRAKLIRHN